MKKVFNKYVAAVVLVVLLLATAVKISSAVAESPGQDWNAKSLKRIDRSRTSFSFAVFGDNQNSVSVFGNLINKVNADSTSFAIDNGDLVASGDIVKFRFFINQARRLRKPLLTNIGNHELYSNGRGLYYDIMGPYYYSFTVGQAYFIVVDDANTVGLDPWQKAWLTSQLQKSQAFKYRFVFMHVPLYDTRTSGFGLKHALASPRNAGELNAMFDNYHVTMLFASHIHEYDRGVWGKTPYIITGGGGGELAGTNPQHYFFHYIRVSVSPSGTRYQVVKLKTPGYNVVDRLVYDTWLYLYAFLAIHYLDMVIVVTLLYLLVFALYTLDEKGMLARVRRPVRKDSGTPGEGDGNGNGRKDGEGIDVH
jgi:hypothetical protein